MVSSWHNEPHSPERERHKPPKTVCDCLSTWRSNWKRRTCNPITLWTVPVRVHVQAWVHILGDPLTLCSVPVLVHVQAWVYILGDPQCSAEECYNWCTKTTKTVRAGNLTPLTPVKTEASLRRWQEQGIWVTLPVQRLTQQQLWEKEMCFLTSLPVYC